MRTLSQTCLPHAGRAGYGRPCSIKFRIVLPGWNRVSNSLQSHQLERSMVQVNLWKQVEKMEISVDFTTISAQFDRECRWKKMPRKQEAFVPLYAPGLNHRRDEDAIKI
jgi:hypothetical protein